MIAHASRTPNPNPDLISRMLSHTDLMNFAVPGYLNLTFFFLVVPGVSIRHMDLLLVAPVDIGNRVRATLEAS